PRDPRRDSPLSRVNGPATPEIYTLSLHDALPICCARRRQRRRKDVAKWVRRRARRSWRVRVSMPSSSSSPGCTRSTPGCSGQCRSEEHTSELQSRENLVCRLLLEKKKTRQSIPVL